MAKKKKAKFKVGQVVGFRKNGYPGYERILAIHRDDAMPEDRLSPFLYELTDGSQWYEEGLRPLTKRERGEARKG